MLKRDEGCARQNGFPARRRVCSSCGKEMESWGLSPVFSCADCEAELCFGCFVRKAEPGRHSKTHRYRVRSARPEIFEVGWAARDDLAMLDAIERVGLGNWADVAQAVGRGHTPRDVEQHYLGLYAGRYGVLVPPKVLLPTGDWVSTNDYPRADELRAVKTGGDDAAPPVGTPYERDVLVPTMSDEQLTRRRASLPGAELLGFMPLRDDFDVEHDNDAELLVADMELRPDDEPADRELKRQILRSYDARLEERERRKRFAIDRGLLDSKRRREVERRLAPEQRQVELRMRGFARFHSVDDHDALVSGIVDADKLAAQMADLRRQIARDAAAPAPAAPQPLQTPPPRERDAAKKTSTRERAISSCYFLRTRLAQADEVDLLSGLEHKLCEALQLPPRKYLEVKEALATGLFNGRVTAAAHIGKRAQIDVDKAAKLYDFARSAGWIMSRHNRAACANGTTTTTTTE